jgi:hypothetical protein
MSKALEITRDIVVAALGQLNGNYPNEEFGKAVSNLIQVVYDKVKEIESAN